MVRNSTSGTKAALGRAAAYLVIIVVSVLFLLPFFWMLKSSFQTVREINAFPPEVFPHHLYLKSYVDGLTAYLPFGRFFLNTVFLTIVVLIGHVFSSSLVAYPFARLTFPGRNILFVVMLSTMMLPPSVTLVPLYLIFSKLRWINTYLPLAVPAFLGWPFYIFLMRQFMMGIPEELPEAARIDGLTEPGIWLRIMVPLCAPALVSISLFSIINTWGDFMQPLIYLRDQATYTIALGLQMMQGLDQQIRWNDVMAVSVLTTIPPMLIFLFFQRYFVQGVTFSGSKA